MGLRNVGLGLGVFGEKGERAKRCCLVEEEEAREMLNMWKGNVTLWAWSPVMLPSTDWPAAIAESM